MFRSLTRSLYTVGRMSKPVMVFGRPVMQQRMMLGVSLGFTGWYLNRMLSMDNYALAQPTVVTDNHTSCAVLVLSINLEYSQDKKLKEFISAVKSITAIPAELGANQKIEPDDDLVPLMVGVGFSTQLWQQLSRTTQKHHRPRDGQRSIPDGVGDIVIHVKGQTQTLCLEAVQRALAKLPQGSYTVTHERYGYKYKDGRQGDLSGFLDGTMNPATPYLRQQNGVIEKTGGSYLMHQVWQHNIEWLNKQPVADQEKWVGRKKQNSEELSPLDVASHVNRTRDAKGQRILIVRQSMPYGTVTGERGLIFLAYANTVDKFDQMLDRMTGLVDGTADNVFKFSRCVFSKYFYIPSTKEIQGL